MIRRSVLVSLAARVLALTSGLAGGHVTRIEKDWKTKVLEK